jgi:hypothetical protein
MDERRHAFMKEFHKLARTNFRSNASVCDNKFPPFVLRLQQAAEKLDLCT